MSLIILIYHMNRLQASFAKNVWRIYDATSTTTAFQSLGTARRHASPNVSGAWRIFCFNKMITWNTKDGGIAIYRNHGLVAKEANTRNDGCENSIRNYPLLCHASTIERMFLLLMTFVSHTDLL